MFNILDLNFYARLLTMSPLELILRWNPFFFNIHTSFTNERISIYLDNYNGMLLGTKDYFVEQIRLSHLSKGVAIIAST